MSATVTLPGSAEPFALGAPSAWTRPQRPIRSRIAYAAAHVVADPLAGNAPGAPAVLDWESTLAFRRHLWSWGLGVAEAMDTAQRGMGLDWPAAQELIRRSAAEARACGGRIAAGAGTDHAPADADLDAVIEAYEQQLAVVEDAGATVILMASRQLARAARGPDDYQRGLRRPARAGLRARDPALARADVRSRARGLLGLARHRRGDRRLPRAPAPPRRQGRRRQGLAARRAARDPPPPRSCPRASACTPATTSTTPS